MLLGPIYTMNENTERERERERERREREREEREGGTDLNKIIAFCKIKSDVINIARTKLQRPLQAEAGGNGRLLEHNCELIGS